MFFCCLYWDELYIYIYIYIYNFCILHIIISSTYTYYIRAVIVKKKGRSFTYFLKLWIIIHKQDLPIWHSGCKIVLIKNIVLGSCKNMKVLFNSRFLKKWATLERERERERWGALSYIVIHETLFRCGTRPNEWGAHWDSNPLLLVNLANHYTS